MPAATSISRRHFLRSAGGVTFLAPVPAGRGLFAAPAAEGGVRLPLFTVLPYIQPGANSLLQDGKESMIVAWQTFAGAAEFSVEFGATPQYGAAAVVTHSTRTAGKGGDAEQRFNWTAEAAGLTLGRKYYYRVRGNNQTLAEGASRRDSRVGTGSRFVAFGDNSYGDISDRAIAYHTYKQNPDFVMNCGAQRLRERIDDEYQRHFLSGL
jgi:phosphodiesterase/alkaline phosphatase D-like protein